MWWPCATVHPHVRGEYCTACLSSGAAVGSSPRAWGILFGADAPGNGHRFIPTCVGNTAAPGQRPPALPVHPHVRGEYGCHFVPRQLAVGSSPRAWGIRVGTLGHGKPLRFIPTCVGNTCHARQRPCWSSVHPHVRGEYTQIIAATQTGTGSSPRAWGIPVCWAWAPKTGRFIPTCVGNTPVYRWGSHCVSVHPHVRGEYLCRYTAVALLLGSSPRAWGILFQKT